MTPPRQFADFLEDIRVTAQNKATPASSGDYIYNGLFVVLPRPVTKASE